jgi:F0F1-type ATP synthase membrane subunit b/b'
MRSKQVRQALLQVTLCVGLAIVALPAHAQESQAQETALLDRVGRWKVLNTAIFVVLLGWFVTKKAPTFFQARSSDIQKAIQEATGLKLEADYRHSEIDRKMANLAGEVQKIREQGEVEMQREHGRIQQDTQTEIERIRHNAANEIEALRQEAADRVQLHTAQLALGQAERSLEERFAHGEPIGSIEDFVRLVQRSNN